ncbi:transcriptional regulator, ArsR family [Pelagirhabdus alkalitolerans]|uniref:HTH-type transcriptional regulator n=1 Tax=Pelagirhabdus alkalitolerans TaxID=1612202 RepID=A0A1G6NC92_9BACI|nr:hypothetical protein [Pelagirhabdus alkalitolerans]SDC65450.1 transcriptional regulator, ArsR family [Pelagirhabdus alkalitolerans]
MVNNTTITDTLIDEFSKTIELFNLSRTDARLFTVLYLNDQPMTMDEMAQAIGKSKTSVNTSIKTLSDLNLTKQVWQKGFRKDLYTTDEDIFQRFMNAYLDRWIAHTQFQRDNLTTVEKQTEKRPQGELIEAKIDKMIQFHLLIEKTFKTIKDDLDSIESSNV